MTVCPERDLFPALARSAHLNWAGMGPISTPAFEAAEGTLTRLRDSGCFDPDYEADLVEETRTRVAGLVRSHPDEIALVTNTTQGLGWVAGGLDLDAGSRVVVQGGTFPSVLFPWTSLGRLGVRVDVVEPVREGGPPIWPLESFLELIEDGEAPSVVAVSWIEYTTGAALDLAVLGEAVHARGGLLCVDVVQGFGVRPLDLHNLPVDFATAGSHKWIGAPAGAGFLYVASEAVPRLRPLEPGWHSVIHRGDYENLTWDPDPAARVLEGGTPNLTGISAYSAALDLIANTGIDTIWERATGLCRMLADGLREAGCDLLSPDDVVESGIVTFRTGEDPLRVAMDAQSRDVVVAAPRAGGVRASVHAWNDEEDIETLLSVVRA